MDNKEIKIVPPKGYEVDKEHSTFECIKFKPIVSKLNKITKQNSQILNNTCWNINKKWAFNMFETEEYGDGYNGKLVSGHNASFYLCHNADGDWYNEAGEKIKGYLYYKPNNE